MPNEDEQLTIEQSEARRIAGAVVQKVTYKMLARLFEQTAIDAGIQLPIVREPSMLSDKPMPRKVTVILGESMFYHPDYGVNYGLLHELKISEKFLEVAIVRYAYEPLFLPNQTPEQRLERWTKVEAFGFPGECMYAVPGMVAAKSADYVIAPYLFQATRGITFSAKLHNARWLMLSTHNLQEDDYRKAIFNVIDLIFS